ncbi:hypothetical protein OROHE_009127 [Orobanche hederae]
MDTHKRQPGQVGGTTPETNRYLTAAEYFLRDRNFDECRNYALRARDSDPTHPGPTRILAIATALSAPTISSIRHDYYAVFGLRHFEPDAARIRYSFRTLTSNLNPNVNPYPLAVEAFDLVLRAWSVLSNPSEKARFDDELRRSLTAGGDGCTSGIDGGTFWTMCPYCYYVYEYDRVYEDCCLKCSNGKCRRVLHALAIRAPPPPPDVVEKGQYWCAGFIPFGISGINGEEIGEKLWGPFESPPAGSASKGCDQNVACNEEGVVVDISDDDDDDEIIPFDGNGNSDETKDSVCGVINRNGNENAFLENGAKQARMRRKKSIPWNSKKLMGRGSKVDEDQANSICGLDEDGDSDANQDTGDVLERGFRCETSNGVESGMEFFEGEDDVLIGLQCGFDLEDGDMSFLNA